MRKVLDLRRLLILAGIVLVAGLLVGVVFRTAALRSLGRFLTVDEVAQKADVIVVPPWAGLAGALEAADLVHAGVSQRVVVLGEPLQAPQRELARRRISFVTGLDNLVHVLNELGVNDVVRLTESVDGTEAEGRVLPSFCKENSLQSIVVISTADHSKRIQRVMRRDMRDAGATTRVTVKSARFSAFDPDAWWQTRDGTRTEIVEFEKLALDLVRHPIL